ncbi:hypothetical protein BH10PSE12_BH10PSE12_18460 [soil metagenome]
MAIATLLKRTIIAGLLVYVGMSMRNMGFEPALAQAPALSLALAPRPALQALTLPQSDYIEHCGGCHGIQGSSAPAQIPVLRDRVGFFMCLPESRRYLIRLPNVAHSRITDNDQLADLMNFVVFGLGKASTPARALPFTGAEVAEQRQFALSSAQLTKVRAAIVNKLIHSCGAPASLRLFYPAQTK